jgi:hypothetical protein
MNPTAKINYINIGLMLISMLLAFILPFELFLFVYAVLGPLHYLTEISWLHDRNYFTKGKYDVLLLLAVGLAITLSNYVEPLREYVNSLMYIAFFSAIIMLFVKDNMYKIIGIVLVIITAKLSENFMLFFTVFLPTLIHVFVFTGLFILFGALKSKSTSGYASLIIFLLCPVALIFVMPSMRPMAISNYALQAYEQFSALNFYTLQGFESVGINTQNMHDIIFKSNTGVVLMRFIAFAYTYHYLNWFSKTNIIKWHEVPKMRFAFVIVIWIISLVLYAVDYKLGFEWLFFLSFIHVLFEFPLNHLSVKGIGAELWSRLGLSK